jgi:hypothetical protein
VWKLRAQTMPPWPSPDTRTTAGTARAQAADSGRPNRRAANAKTRPARVQCIVTRPA